MNVGAVLFDSSAQTASVLHDDAQTLSPSTAAGTALWSSGAFDKEPRTVRHGKEMEWSGAPRAETSVHTVQTDLNPDLARPVTTVLDARTQEVIREIPSEDIQRIAAKLKDTMGLIFDREG